MQSYLFMVLFISSGLMLTSFASPSLIMRIHEYIQNRQNDAITLPRHLNAIYSLFPTHEQTNPEYDLVVSIKTNEIQMEENDSTVSEEDAKQIPVISDIERIKKVAQILETVGEKVIPFLLENVTFQPTSALVSAESKLNNRRGLKFLNSFKREMDEITVTINPIPEETDNDDSEGSSLS